jgi:hypothetical protein
MNRGEQIFPHHFFIDYDGILEVVPFPRHKCHLEVAPQSHFAALNRVSFCKEIPLLNPLSFLNGRTMVNAGFLVGFDEFREVVDLKIVFK